LDHNGIKLEINSKRNYRKYLSTWRLNNILLNDQKVIEEIKWQGGGEEGKWIKKILESNEKFPVKYLWDTAKTVC
jgi:hypothetical protein